MADHRQWAGRLKASAWIFLPKRWPHGTAHLPFKDGRGGVMVQKLLMLEELQQLATRHAEVADEHHQCPDAYQCCYNEDHPERVDHRLFLLQLIVS